MSAVMQPTRHHNRPLILKPMHARQDRKVRRTARTFENAAHAAHWLVWTAQHKGWSR